MPRSARAERSARLARVVAALAVGVALGLLAAWPSGRWATEGGLVVPAVVAGEGVGEVSTGRFWVAAVQRRQLSVAAWLWSTVRGQPVEAGWAGQDGTLGADGAATAATEAPDASMDRAKDTAWAVAVGAAGSLAYRGSHVSRVVGATPGSPAASGGVLPGDVLVSVDGGPPLGSVVDLDLGSGRPAVLHIVREGALRRLTLAPRPPWPQPPAGGLLLEDVAPGSPLERPDIPTEQVEGASGGLQLALAYLDALLPGDLTGGHSIAGSAELSPSGTVFGGVRGLGAKMAAARDAGAEVFFVAPDDLGHALAEAPAGLEVVAVSGVGDAVVWLCGHGGTAPACANVAGGP